jgi:hypothetical protein
MLLILSLPLFLQPMLCLPCFCYKKALTPIGPPHFKLLPSSLDLDLDLAMAQRIDLVGRKLLLLSLLPPPRSLNC